MKYPLNEDNEIDVQCVGIWLLNASNALLNTSLAKTPLRDILHPPHYSGPIHSSLCCPTPPNRMGVVLDRSRFLVRRAIVPIFQVALD